MPDVRRLLFMDGSPVLHLAHAAPPMAEAIRAVMFEAYLVEAGLLGVQDFVPLRRTAAHIASSDALFLGISPAGTLAAVAEVESPEPDHVHIGSLVVLPSHFRRGFGTALVRHIVDANASSTFTVSTGVRNQPALLLYNSQGFREHQLWTTNDGISMVTLRRTAGSSKPAV